MTMITEAYILSLARRYQQYEAASKVVTLRGAGVIEFARALLAEVNGQRIGELLAVRAALDGQQPIATADPEGHRQAMAEYTPPGTHGSPAAPKEG